EIFRFHAAGILTARDPYFSHPSRAPQRTSGYLSCGVKLERSPRMIERSSCMFGTRRTREFLLVLACCFALVLIPLSAGAQNILEKGAHGVKKGVETGAEKTKEGAQSVGHGVKKAVTGDDTSREKTTEGEYTTQQPSKPATHPTKSPTG